MTVTSVLLSSVLLVAEAHLAISLYPIGGGELKARDNSIGDNYRSPAQSSACHGTTPGAAQVTIAAGTKVEAKTTFGAGHNGGHCAWFVTEDQLTWYKINDLLDCTAGDANQPHPVTLPLNLPISCKTRCTLGWFWTPRSSGACEIYNNCFDIQVPNAVGGIETASFSMTTPLTCARIDPGTGISTMFGSTLIADGSEGTSNPVSPDTGVNGGDAGTVIDTVTGCTTYTVKSGDTLIKIAERFDIADYKEIQDLNNIADASAINIGQILKIPGDCGTNTTNTVMLGQATMGGYPEYTGTAIAGVIIISQKATGELSLNYNLAGLEASASGGLHIHVGTTCGSHSEIAGHYFKDSTTDPWSTTTVWASDTTGVAIGSFSVVEGYSLAEVMGHAIVVHNAANTRVACGLILAVGSPTPASAAPTESPPSSGSTVAVTLAVVLSTVAALLL